MKKRTTHKIITNAVHVACLAAAVYIFAIWRDGIVTDAAQMLQYVAWVEIVNLSQYSAKSAYDHHCGIFDGAGTQAATQAMQSNDLGYGPAQVEQAMEQQVEQSADDQQLGTVPAQPPQDGKTEGNDQTAG